MDMRYVELVRHTDNDGDMLTSKGIAAAEAIGHERLTPPYLLFGSTGARRATEMVEILRRIVGQEDVPVTVVRGLRSSGAREWATSSSRTHPVSERGAGSPAGSDPRGPTSSFC